MCSFRPIVGAVFDSESELDLDAAVPHHRLDEEGNDICALDLASDEDEAVEDAKAEDEDGDTGAVDLVQWAHVRSSAAGMLGMLAHVLFVPELLAHVLFVAMLACRRGCGACRARRARPGAPRACCAGMRCLPCSPRCSPCLLCRRGDDEVLAVLVEVPTMCL